MIKSTTASQSGALTRKVSDMIPSPKSNSQKFFRIKIHPHTKKHC